MLNIKKSAFRLALQAFVDVYNSGEKDTGKQLALVEGKGKIVASKTEEIFNTMNLFVCVYGDWDFGICNRVGVFKGTKYVYTEKIFDKTIYCTGMVYEDIILGEVGIFHGKDKSNVGDKKLEWQYKYFQANGYTATCNMTKAVPFEEVRSGLKIVEKIDDFEPGKATLSEIYEVLELAPQYLGLTQKSKTPMQKV